MAQNFFGTLTAPSLPLLDANFTELYALRSLFTIAGGSLSLVGSVQSWGTNHRAIEIGGASAGHIVAPVNSLNIGANYYATNSADKYVGTGSAAAQYVLNGSSGTHSFRTAVVGTAAADITWDERLHITNGGVVRPGGDNTQTLGSAALRWSVVYAGTGTINTSDAREKTAVRGLSAQELAAAKDLAREIGAFQFLSAVAAKGAAAARVHLGLTVQRAMQIMRSHGLDPCAYAFICHDVWPQTVRPAQTELRPSGMLQADGSPLMVEVETVPAQTLPAGDRFGFRVDELLLFVARGFEARLSALEAAAEPARS